ncbi:MAG: methyl-accepting chemotaxis protein [Treponema sp.]|nr:methyl-accepting chemotaxis protein [Treponema sp.]
MANTKNNVKKTLTLKTQFISQAVVCIFLLAGLLATLVISWREQLKMADLSDQQAKLAGLSNELLQTTVDLTQACRLYVLTGNDKYYSDYKVILAWRKGAEPRPATLQVAPEETISQDELFRRHGAIETEMSYFERCISIADLLIAEEDQVIDTIRRGRYVAGPNQLLPGETPRAFAQRILMGTGGHERLSSLSSLSSNGLLLTENRLGREVAKSERIHTILSFISIGLTLIVAIFIFRFISFIDKKIITALVNIARKFTVLSQGDLTQPMRVFSNDEIGKMAQAYNDMLESFKTLVHAIQTNSSALADAGADLSANMIETSSSITQMTSTIENVKQQVLNQATGIEESANTVQNADRMISHLNNQIESQSTNVTESSAAIEEMVNNVISISRTLEKMDGIIKKLSAATTDGMQSVKIASNAVQKVTEESETLTEAGNIIQNIANQTNLLAMNAAIEAAHAGETGKGFAIVAGEIRKLANESSRQGQAIFNSLQELGTEINAMTEAASNVLTRFQNISAYTVQAQDMSTQITEAMKQQESGSREVLESVKEIDTITMDVRNDSSSILQGSREIAKEMEMMNDLTRTITSSMNEMADGAKQISTSVDVVNNLTQKTKNSIDELANEIKKFKIN